MIGFLGEITASGEVPPSYNAITRDRSTSTSTNNTTRGRQNNRPGESPSQIDSSSTNSDTRGESSSMNRGARSASALRS